MNTDCTDCHRVVSFLHQQKTEHFERCYNRRNLHTVAFGSNAPGATVLKMNPKVEEHFAISLAQQCY